VFFGATRNDVFEPMDANDPIFSSPFFQKFNPERNPTLHDLCVRRMPLDKINPSLLEKKGKLVEAFCAGVWGGMGKLWRLSRHARDLVRFCSNPTSLLSSRIHPPARVPRQQVPRSRDRQPSLGTQGSPRKHLRGRHRDHRPL
jgi:hypothetical protein